MLRLLLAALVALSPGLPGAVAEEGGDRPVNLLAQPDLLTKADGALLASAGYQIEDGFVRRAGEEPLTARKLSEILAALKADRRVPVRGDRPRTDAARDRGERARVVVERVQRVWDEKTGQEPGSEVSLFDGQIPRERGSSSWARTGRAALRDAVAQSSAYSFSARPATHPYSLLRVSASEAGTLSSTLGARPGGVGVLPPGSAAAVALPRKDAKNKGSLKEPPSPTQSGSAASSQAQPGQPKAPVARLASFFLSQDMVSEIVKSHLQGSALRDLSVEFDPADGDVSLKGILRVPTESLDGLNLDQVKVPDFRFQVTVNLKTTKEGYIALVFPLEDTFFYPADSKNPEKDRVNVPLPFLQLAMASARGYINMLSGDFSGLDRQAQTIRGKMAALDKKIAAAKDADARQELQDEREQLDLKLQALAVQRRQAERAAKKVTSSLHFVSEKEIHLNQILESDDNALIFKLDVQQLAPFLKGIQLGGIRILKDTQEGSGENFIAIDLVAAPAQAAGHP